MVEAGGFGPARVLGNHELTYNHSRRSGRRMRKRASTGSPSSIRPALKALIELCDGEPPLWMKTTMEHLIVEACWLPKAFIPSGAPAAKSLGLGRQHRGDLRRLDRSAVLQ